MNEDNIVLENNRVSFFKRRWILIVVIIILFVVVYLVMITNGSFTSNTRSIKGVSEDTNELFRLIGFEDKELTYDIIKTKDNKFWFFSADDNDCDKKWSCTAPGYIIDVDNKTISNFIVDSISNAFGNVVPIYNSLVVINIINNNGKYNQVIYDPSVNEVIDRLDYSNESGILPSANNFSFISEKYGVYTNDDILYIRDTEKHISIQIGKYYLPGGVGIDNMDIPKFISHDQKTLYALIYKNTYDKKPYDPTSWKVGGVVNPQKDDPLVFIAWDFESGTSKNITSQIFNFPFVFKPLSKNLVLIGGGRSGFGLITYPTYIVEIDTGKTKMIYNGLTNAINIDETKKTITILGSKEGNYWSPYKEYSDYLIIFDYDGNLLSKNDLKDGNPIPAKDSFINNTSTRVSSYPNGYTSVFLQP